MTQFNGHIKVDEESLHFSFNRIFNAEGEKFYVVVEKGKSFFPFDMKKDPGGQWKIVDPAPAWAKALEAQISQMIQKNL